MGTATSKQLGGEGIQQYLRCHIQNKVLRAGASHRIALLVASDDAAAKQKVMALVEELGFDAVNDGGLHESWRRQSGTPPLRRGPGED